MRVFIASASAEERAELAARVAESGSWQIVSDPAWADVVLVSPEGVPTVAINDGISGVTDFVIANLDGEGFPDE